MRVDDLAGEVVFTGIDQINDDVVALLRDVDEGIGVSKVLERLLTVI